MKDDWRRAFHPLGPFGSQGMSQAISLAVQFGMIYLLGEQTFANVGLGLLTATSLCFLGELGYGPFFLKQAARDPDWLVSWRGAVTQRAVALAILLLVGWALLAWAAPEPGQALALLAAAAPGILASACNPAGVLYGLGRPTAAGASTVLRAAIQGGGAILLLWFLPGMPGLMVGAAFSAAVLGQLVVGLVAGLPAAFLMPGRTALLPPTSATRLWFVSIAGAVNDRALPYVVGVARPDLLGIAIILIQVLQSLAGLLTMMDRLVVPAVARGGISGSPVRLTGLAMAVTATGFAACLFGAAWFARPDLIGMAALLWLEWAAVLAGALGFSVAFAQGNERRCATLIIAVVPLSTVVQVAFAGMFPLEVPLALRACVAAAMAFVAGFSAFGRGRWVRAFRPAPPGNAA